MVQKRLFATFQFDTRWAEMMALKRVSRFLLCLVPDSPPINITAFPFNTTAIQMHWHHVPEELQNGIILGYRVILYDKTGSYVRNITVQGLNTTSLKIGGLEVWTNYSVQVCAFTIKGNGPWSSRMKSRSAEEGN